MAGRPRGQAPRRPLGFVTPAWVALVLLVLMGIGSIVDLVVPGRVALMPLVVAPFVSAVVLPFRTTVVVAALSLALAVVLPEAFVTADGYQYLRFSALAALDVLAVVSTLWRERLVSARVRLARERERAVLARRHALEVNDQIYQSLVAARLWADMGDRGRSDAALDKAVHGTADLLGDLLVDVPLHPGSLRWASSAPKAPSVIP